jgi:isopentenyl diphosphate isomerase/L-lactate dehydrogenase-like FMN-dependent dehydrogenase
LAGEAGAKRAIDILGTEVRRVLGLLGCPSIAQLSTDYLLYEPRFELQRFALSPSSNNGTP